MRVVSKIIENQILIVFILSVISLIITINVDGISIAHTFSFIALIISILTKVESRLKENNSTGYLINYVRDTVSVEMDKLLRTPKLLEDKEITIQKAEDFERVQSNFKGKLYYVKFKDQKLYDNIKRELQTISEILTYDEKGTIETIEIAFDNILKYIENF